MKTTIKIHESLPFEEGQTYITKGNVPEPYELVKIVTVLGKDKQIVIVGFQGIYTNRPHLGLCPLNPDRLVPVLQECGEVEVCDNCGCEINT